MNRFVFLALFLLLAHPAQADLATPALDKAADKAVQAPASAPATPAPPPATRKWKMIADDSSVTFHGKQMGKDFDGKILQFTAEIYFDPDKLKESKVIADMNMQTIDAGDTDRNKNLLSKEWLNVIDFPTARFETQEIKSTGGNAYVAEATLTIHGAIQELEFPFTIDFSKVEDGKDSGKDMAVMQGKITLDRSKFQLGTGDWADPSVIANEIPVEVKVTAVSDKQP